MRRRRRRGRRFLGVAGVLAALGLVIVVAWGCNDGGGADVTPLGLTSAGGWTFPQPNPIIKAGDLRPRALWNDPCVVQADGQYVMYMTTSVDAPFEPPILPFRAVSKDGLTWALSPDTPLMTPAGTPFASLETPSVVWFRGMYHMYVTGVYAKPDPAPMAIGHARSPDGIHWTVTPQPVIAATGKAEDWNGYLVGEPGAIVWNDQVFVYFSAVGARPGGHPPQLQTIGLAKSSDGTNFQPASRVVEQASLYPPEKDFVGYSTPAAFELGGRIHLVYDVALNRRRADPEWQQAALHHAVATDETGTKFAQDAAPGMTRSQLPWPRGARRAPTVLGDGPTLRLWFAGNVRRADLGPLIRRGIAGPEFGIGYATRPAAELP